MKVCLWRGSTVEKGKERSRKTVETGGAGGLDINFVTIATEPSSRVVTVRCWNITTS